MPKPFVPAAPVWFISYLGVLTAITVTRPEIKAAPGSVVAHEYRIQHIWRQLTAFES